jgi:hypothetical protein
MAFGQHVRVGRAERWVAPEGEFWVHRQHSNTLRFSRSSEQPARAATDEASRTAQFRMLWDWLAAADTPEEREARALGVVHRLPCGECKREWPGAVLRHPPVVDTADGWRRWLWDRRMDIRERKGLERLPYPAP